jgi:sortase A
MDASGQNDRPAAAATGHPVRTRWLRLAADLLLVVGGLMLAYPFWSAAYAQVQQARLDSTYRQQSVAFVQDINADQDTRGGREVSDEELVRRLALGYAKRITAGDPIGRLRIPRIDLDRLVQQGVSGKKALDPEGDRSLLRNGPVHYGNTPLPGAGDPFAVAGHRTTYGAPFYELDKLRKGDPIYVDTPYGKFRYSVAKTTTVDPTDTGVLDDRGYGLVLTTCTPPYSAAQRLVVWALLEKARPLRAARGR